MKARAAPIAPLLLVALAVTMAFAPLGQEEEPTQQAVNWIVTVVITPVNEAGRNPQLRPGSSGWVWSVDPYHLVIAEGDTVTWVVEWAACEAQDIVPRIRVSFKEPPKKVPPWPFFEPPHIGDERVTADWMIPEPQGHYEYDIDVQCPGAGAGWKVHIDPDMDVE